MVSEKKWVMFKGEDDPTSIPVEWICWLNGQRKSAPTPEEMAEMEARREFVKLNVARLKKEEEERKAKQGKSKATSIGKADGPDLKSFIQQFPDASEGDKKAEAADTQNNSSLLQEDEYHRLANATIHHLLEKLENEVLTLKLGSMGTYVINKQTPNRQIWMSSPVSGPSRFDWDQNSQGWVYRRTKENLLKVLEEELEKHCGSAVDLS